MGTISQLRKRASRPENTGPARPMPPGPLVLAAQESMAFAPAVGMDQWVEHHLLRDTSPLYNPDHRHLTGADLAFLWAATSFARQGRTVLGTCEQVMFRAGGWQKARQEVQMLEWFGRVPKFLITLAADYCDTCGDTEFCALLEHELSHVGQKHNEFGEPEFDRDGNPKLYLRGHDVEEFIGVVRRYGVPAKGALRDLVDAAGRAPEVAQTSIASACGTCLQAAGVA